MLLLFTIVAPGPVLSAAAEPTDCRAGVSVPTATTDLVPESALATADGAIWAAGGAPLSFGRRAARIGRLVGQRWTIDSTKRLGNDAGYVALGSGPRGQLWAVGYQRETDHLEPLVVRQRGSGRWQRVAIPPAARGASTLTDVAVRSPNDVWVVGYRLGRPGQRKPIAMRWNGTSWTAQDPRLAETERGMLAGLSSAAGAGTWVAGAVSRNGLEHPYVARRRAGRWERMDLPAVGGGALSAIDVSARQQGWAVGYRVTSGGLMPLIMRWDGQQWRTVDPPSDVSGPTVLLDVRAGPDGMATIAGSTWSPDARHMRGLAWRWDGEAWSRHQLRGRRTDLAMTSLTETPDGATWVSGRGLVSGVLAELCSETETSGAESTAVDDATGAAGTAAVPADRAQDTATTPNSAGEPTSDTNTASDPQSPGPVRIRDVTAEVGLPTRSPTWGATIGDFDGDGREDIFLGRHGGSARLYLADGDGFIDSGQRFGGGDRHGCAASDVDGSGRLDLYCNFGGGRGLGVKTNQLWLDPGGPDPNLDPSVGGVVEPLGRGRQIAFFDADGDGRDDLYVGQEPNRVDGLPSPSRLYIHDGESGFEAVTRTGIADGLGVKALDSADIDGDLRQDLLLVFEDLKASGRTRGLKLYHNTASGFINVARDYGVRSIGERDAALVDLDGDGRPDLVQVGDDRVRVSLQRDGRLEPVFERSVPGATAVASGDADGDGDADLYVLRDKVHAKTRDLVLFNRRSGRNYRATPVPSRSGGRADDVVAIDHDQNGLTDFLALNGKGAGRGPVQLIAFFR